VPSTDCRPNYIHFINGPKSHPCFVSKFPVGLDSIAIGEVPQHTRDDW